MLLCALISAPYQYGNPAANSKEPKMEGFVLNFRLKSRFTIPTRSYGAAPRTVPSYYVYPPHRDPMVQNQMSRLPESSNRRDIYYVASRREKFVLDLGREFCSGDLWPAEGEVAWPYTASRCIGSTVYRFKMINDHIANSLKHIHILATFYILAIT